MSTYRYRAARADGHMVTGVLEARATHEASAVLAERGLSTVALYVEPEQRRRSAPRRHLAMVFQSLASLVAAGVPVERALAATERVATGILRETLTNAAAGLREGQTLSQAFTASHGVVPPVVLGMVRAGERGSALPTTLEHIARHLEQEANLTAHVRQALAYPLLLATAGTVSVLVIGTVIIPRFAGLLSDFGQQLPLTTTLLLSGSAFLARFWFVLVGLATALLWGGARWLDRPGSRLIVDEALLTLPLVGPVRHALATARAARALGGMLGAGMPVVLALDAARDAAGDHAVAARLARVQERIVSGAPLDTSLEREGALLPAALPIIAVGEASGRLADMAQRAGDLAALDAERGLRTLVTLLEPALILSFGGLVAFVSTALLQAVYSLRPS